jgi:peptide chain release factor 2
MQHYNELQDQIESAYNQLEIDSLIEEKLQLSALMQAADFWTNTDEAKRISKEHAALEKRIDFWDTLRKNIREIVELAGLTKDDSEMVKEVENQYLTIKKKFAKARRELQFSGVYDSSEVILSIFAGAGGTDAQDWAEMLLRMYTRWAEKEGLSVTTIDVSAGDEAGIKSATIELAGGSFLYGRLQSENGVHRLVRLSPFNADSLRQTSFARVEVIPRISSPKNLEIDEKDLKVDVYRSGGKGGQSVNTTDSAVRLTHLPTNIVVAIQNERSQLQNKETAMTILRSKLAQLRLEQHADTISELKGPSEQAAWGNQIRNYVLHPYTMVKDTRTKHETTDAQAVLDGNLNDFIEAYLDSLIQA